MAMHAQLGDRLGMFAFARFFFFFSNIMEQILWFIKLLCTSLVEQTILGVSTRTGTGSHRC